jgi:hypothetical protein
VLRDELGCTGDEIEQFMMAGAFVDDHDTVRAQPDRGR